MGTKTSPLEEKITMAEWSFSPPCCGTTVVILAIVGAVTIIYIRKKGMPFVDQFNKFILWLGKI